MKTSKTLFCTILSALILFSSCTNKEWTPLLDKDLSKWEKYISFEHKPGYNGALPADDNGEPLKPAGYNTDEKNVFSVIEENGEPVLKVTGEVYGCVYTKEEFENYHLKLKVKWGSKKWEPRLNEPMDSGILYHSIGEAGVDYWRSWMLSQECQLIEDGMGDYWPIANSRIDIRAEKPENSEFYIFTPEAEPVSFGAGGTGNYCQRRGDFEKPKGEWDTVELICFQDKSLHIVNGKVVMALSNSTYVENEEIKPLTKGKIQLQSEAAEVFFKEILIKNIAALPDAYSGFFE